MTENAVGDVSRSAERGTRKPAPVVRLGLLERFAARRAAAAAARRRIPVPTLLPKPLSTPWRDAQWRDRDRKVEAVRRDFERRMQEQLRDVELCRREIAERQQRIEQGKAELERRRSEPPDPTERRFGDAGQPAAVVAGRRRAPWAAELGRLRRDIEAEAERRQLAREALIAIESELAVGRRACALAAQEAHRLCQVRLAHHDHALLGRHPDRDLIADVLDRDGPPLPEWVAAWLSGAEELEP